MRVLVIGAGWYGCHLASALIEKSCDVKIFDAAQEFISGAGLRNQLRLHQGFHYLRSKITRTEAFEGFNKFLKKYPDLSTTISSNIYAIPERDSALDLGTVLEIAEASNLPFEALDPANYPWLKAVEGLFLTQERYIEARKSRDYFEKTLGHCTLFGTRVSVKDLQSLSKEFDFVIDTTYSFELLEPKSEIFEATLIGEFDVDAQAPEFQALTLIDGPFWSIFPTEKPTVRSLSHVAFGPLLQSESEKDVTSFISRINEKDVRPNLDLMKHEVQRHVPTLANSLKSLRLRFVQKKIKTSNMSASREVRVERQGNIIFVRAGKIDAVFTAEQLVLKEIFGEIAA